MTRDPSSVPLLGKDVRTKIGVLLTVASMMARDPEVYGRDQPSAVSAGKTKTKKVPVLQWLFHLWSHRRRPWKGIKTKIA